MNKVQWVDIDDKHKPAIGERVLIKVPVCEKYNIVSATYKGEGEFLGCWFDTYGANRTYKVSKWMTAEFLYKGDGDE